MSHSHQTMPHKCINIKLIKTVLVGIIENDKFMFKIICKGLRAQWKFKNVMKSFNRFHTYH